MEQRTAKIALALAAATTLGGCVFPGVKQAWEEPKYAKCLLIDSSALMTLGMNDDCIEMSRNG